MKPLTIILSLILLCGVTMGVLFFVVERGPQTKTSLSAQLLSPSPDAAGTITLDSMQQVEFRWKIQNDGNLALENLGIAAGCCCRVPEPPPAILRPGESAEIAVKLVSPNAGRSERIVPVFRKGDSKPLLALKTVMNVLVVPPKWLASPSAIDIRAIAGEVCSREFVWDAVEKRQSKQWVQRIGLDDSDSLSAEMRVEEQPWGEDQETVLRKYRITIRMTSPSATFAASNLDLFKCDEMVLVSVPVRVELLRPISVIPTQLIVHADSPPQKLVLLRRTEEIGIVSARFEERLLKVSLVKAAEHGPLVYEVRPQERTSSEPVETEVVFHSQDRELAKVHVKFD